MTFDQDVVARIEHRPTAKHYRQYYTSSQIVNAGINLATHTDEEFRMFHKIFNLWNIYINTLIRLHVGDDFRDE